MVKMNLGDRKLAILRMIIDDYITTAEPVGSRTIAKKYNNEISSSTIRNEMADLEEMGFLQQLHTSSGRIPSDKAYRFYVDRLMQVNALSQQEAFYIKEMYERKSAQLEDMLMLTAKTIADITNYTAIAAVPKIETINIKHIRLVPVDERFVLVIIVTNTGVVKDILLQKSDDLDEEYLSAISSMLNRYFCNRSIAEIDDKLFEELKHGMDRDKIFFNSLVDVISEVVEPKNSRKVYVEGLNNILDLPEYSDIEKAREFFTLMKKKEMMYDLLNDSTKNGLSIHIGDENPSEEMKSYSIVTAAYCVNNKIRGAVGIIGPKRMNYPKIVSLLGSVVDNLTEHLKEKSTDNEE